MDSRSEVAYSHSDGMRQWLTRVNRYPWIAPTIGLAMTGLGFFTIFQAALNYLVDTFQKYAASAVAANSEFSPLPLGGFPS